MEGSTERREDSPSGEPSRDFPGFCRAADSQQEPATRLHVNRLNVAEETAPHRHYADEDAPEPLPLFPEPLPLFPEPLPLFPGLL